MRRLMMVALVAGTAALTADATPAAACGSYGYRGCGCGYSSAYYYRPVYGAYYRPAYYAYRPAYAYAGFYRPRVWGWGGWGGRRWGYRGWRRW
jgi:hypothetical protein